jgi:hypothetical protein
MESIEIQSMLKAHEYMWAGSGPVWKSGDAIGYAQIGGRKSGQEIWINNDLLPDRPDWRYSICEDGKCIWVNKHFKSATEAYSSALAWLDLVDHRPRLRVFEWYEGHSAYVVDGLDPDTFSDAIVIERVPGEWLLNVTMENGPSFWLGPWSSPMDALTV